MQRLGSCVILSAQTAWSLTWNHSAPEPYATGQELWEMNGLHSGRIGDRKLITGKLQKLVLQKRKTQVQGEDTKPAKVRGADVRYREISRENDDGLM